MLITAILTACFAQTAEIQQALDLRLAVEKVLQGFPGKAWIAAKNLNTGTTFNLKGDERVRTASTIKLPILVALYGEANKGKVRWEDKLTVDKKTRAQGAGILLEMEDGHTLNVREASRLMIVVSDNTATNLILDKIGIDTVNDWMDQLGLTKTRSLAWIGGGTVSKARSGDWNKRADGTTYGIGVSTPMEMVQLLDKLNRGEIISPEASKEILGVLGRQQYKDGLGRGLTGSRVANKTGALDRLRSDVGIITVGKEKFAVAITLDDLALPPDWTPDNPGLRMLGQLSQLLVQGLKGSQTTPPTPPTSPTAIPPEKAKP